MKNLFLNLLLAGLILDPVVEARNPLFFGADPSALVAPDGRIWVYPTTDEPIWDDQVDWHAWSSTNLVDWTDHGVIFSNADSGWGINNAWAPDCAYRDGKYYFYYYFNKGRPGGGVGVAVSDRPEGPFKEALGHRLIPGHDPAVFIDDDGQAYLYVQTSAYKLNPDMISLAGGEIQLEIDYRPKPFEAVYVFKRNGIYYYTKAAEFNRLVYYTGDNPLGPFTYRGEIMDKYGGNNHHSIVPYQGRWILFHHGWVPGRHRLVRAEWLEFNDDGTIVKVPVTEEGTGPMACPPAAAARQDSLPKVPPSIYVDDLAVHDPFILAEPVTKTYHIYRGYSVRGESDPTWGQAKNAGVLAYTSRDLVKWTGPTVVFEIPDGFWADADSGPWAPEVHEYKGRYYLFTTFNAWGQEFEKREGRPFLNRRASQVLVGDTPLGPFKPFSNRPTTPDGEMTLDATFWVEGGRPYMVYCHEWVQIGDGLIKAVELKPDLSAAVGEPFTILNAADFPWTKRDLNYRGTNWTGAVTDGPFLYRMGNGGLAMLWSSHTPEHQYAQDIVYSPSGRLAGPWIHDEKPVLWDDRGHGMLFRAHVNEGKLHESYDGKLLLVLHRYFRMPRTRVQIFEVEDAGDRLKVGRQILGAP